MITRLKHCTAGLTLVEVLVVGAVLSILAALIAPALRAGMSQSAKVTVASNMRQVGMALILYAQDHGDSPVALPPMEEAMLLARSLPTCDQQDSWRLGCLSDAEPPMLGSFAYLPGAAELIGQRIGEVSWRRHVAVIADPVLIGSPFHGTSKPCKFWLYIDKDDTERFSRYGLDCALQGMSANLPDRMPVFQWSGTYRVAKMSGNWYSATWLSLLQYIEGNETRF